MDQSPIVTAVPEASAHVEHRDICTAWHYGQPLVEQRRVMDGQPGVVDHWDHVLLRIAGSESRSWLNSLVSQKVNAISPGQSAMSLILDAQGRVEHFFSISAAEPTEGGLEGAVDLLLDISADQVDAVEEYLRRMIFWADVTVDRLDLAKLTVISSSDYVADATLSTVHPVYRNFSRLGDLTCLNMWFPRHEVLSAWMALTGNQAEHDRIIPVGLMAWEALRITAGVPAVASDIDTRTIPHEVPLFIGEVTGATQLAEESEGPSAAAVHINKGCYRGQETVSRVQNLGKSPRVLVRVHLDGSANTLPPVGSDLTAGGKSIGRVGSSVHDTDYGPIALALVKRSVVEKIATDPLSVPALLVDGVDAQIDRDDCVAAVTVGGERPGREAIQRLRNGS